MGIPGFYGLWLRNYAALALSRQMPSIIASLFFDVNSIYHEALRLATKPAVNIFADPRQQAAVTMVTDLDILLPPVRMNLQNIILNAFQAVHPIDGLYFAVDGPVPAAKLAQQRPRRFRTAYASAEARTYDSNALTPGTELMFRLEEFMGQFIASHQQGLPIYTVFSGHLVPGEGEHKIMDLFRAGAAMEGPAAKAGGAHVIWGNDADLSLLSMLVDVNHIYIARDDNKDLVNVDQLKMVVRNKIENSDARPTCIHDFVALMMFMGNDFLPHQPSLQRTAEDAERLLSIYSKGGYQLTSLDQPGEWHYPGLLSYLQELSQTEGMALAQMSQITVKYPSRYLNAALTRDPVTGEPGFDPSLFRAAWYRRALGPKGDQNLISTVEAVARRHIPTAYEIDNNILGLGTNPGSSITEITLGDINNICIAYLRTLAWTYRYYVLGTAAVNTDWAYPYYHCPLFTDLFAVLANNPVISGYQSYTGMRAFNALQQLVAVLPLSSVELLPEELRPLMGYESPIRDLFPVGFQLEMDGRHMDYEGVSIVPMIDRNRIINAVDTIAFSPAYLLRWKEGTVFELRRTEAEDITLKNIEQQRNRAKEWHKGPQYQRDNNSARETHPGRPGPERKTSEQSGTRGARPFTGRPLSPGSSASKAAAQSFVPTALVPLNQQPVMMMPGVAAGNPVASSSTTTVVSLAQQPIMMMAPPPQQGPIQAFTSLQAAPQGSIQKVGNATAIQNLAPVRPLTTPTATIPLAQQPITVMPGQAYNAPVQPLGPARPIVSAAVKTPAKPIVYPGFTMKTLM